MSAADILKKEQAKAKRERWEKQLERDLRAVKIEGFSREFKFHEKRKWLFDFAFIHYRLAVEVDGGIWMDKGGHNTGKGILDDRRKDQAAILAGWTVYRVVPEMIESGEALQTIETLLKHGLY